MLMRSYRAIKKTEEKINRCPSIYAVILYAHWCVREYKWTGKFIKYGDLLVPEVWHYDDHNGEYEEYYKTRLDLTTTGFIITWGYGKKAMQYIADALEEKQQSAYNKSLD